MTQTSINDLEKKDYSTDYWGEQLQRDLQELSKLPSLSNVNGVPSDTEFSNITSKLNESIEIKNQLCAWIDKKKTAYNMNISSLHRLWRELLKFQRKFANFFIPYLNLCLRLIRIEFKLFILEPPFDQLKNAYEDQIKKHVDTETLKLMNLYLYEGKSEITIESLKSTHFIPPTDLFKHTNQISEFCIIFAKNHPEVFDIEEIIRSGDKNLLKSFKRFAEQNAWKADLSDNKITSIKEQSERLSKYIDTNDITFKTQPAQDALIAIAQGKEPNLNSDTNAEIQSIKASYDSSNSSFKLQN